MHYLYVGSRRVEPAQLQPTGCRMSRSISPSGQKPSDGLELSFVQSEALRRFSRDAERAEASTHVEKRLDARQSLALAKAAMSPRECAIIDLVILRGRPVAALAAQSGTTVQQLENLLRQAANDLVDHYQSRNAA